VWRGSKWQKKPTTTRFVFKTQPDLLVVADVRVVCGDLPFETGVVAAHIDESGVKVGNVGRDAGQLCECVAQLHS
jgi:hypothetical protein